LTNTKSGIKYLDKNSDTNENISYLEENTYTDGNISEKTDISSRLDPILNNFSHGENPAIILPQRRTLATSLILGYINENGGLSDEVIKSIPYPHKHFSPDGLFNIHHWSIPYAGNASSTDSQRFRSNEGYHYLTIEILQYKENSGEIITIAMNDILDMLSISNIRLLDKIKEKGILFYPGEYSVKILNDNMYLLSYFSLYKENEDNSIWRNYHPGSDRYWFSTLFVVKYEKNKFTLQKAFNGETSLMLFSSSINSSENNTYGLNGCTIDSGNIKFKAEKYIGEREGSSCREDLSIYDYKYITLGFSGSEFMGDYEYLFELSKNAEPSNFSMYSDVSIVENKKPEFKIEVQ
jgi:hypothetical protein